MKKAQTADLQKVFIIVKYNIAITKFDRLLTRDYNKIKKTQILF